MDALGNLSHVGVNTHKAGHRAGIDRIGWCSPGKELSLTPYSGELLKSFKQKNIFKKSYVSLIRMMLVLT